MKIVKIKKVLFLNFNQIKTINQMKIKKETILLIKKELKDKIIIILILTI